MPLSKCVSLISVDLLIVTDLTMFIQFVFKRHFYSIFFASSSSPNVMFAHAAYRDDRSFQLRKMYAHTRNTKKIMTKATMSSVKLASTMSNSCNVVSGERKWQYVWWHSNFLRPNEYVAKAVPSKP